MKIGFIGVGKMASAIITGLKKTDFELIISDSSLKAGQDKAEALVKEYFEAMAEKDMDRLNNIFYQKDVLKCFAVSNDMTEEKVLESLKEQVDKLELTYKEESISDYSAYPEIYVNDMNDSIYKAIGKENVIKYIYSISIKYMQLTTIGWEEKSDSIKVYVIDDGYYIWPSTGEEK